MKPEQTSPQGKESAMGSAAAMRRLDELRASRNLEPDPDELRRRNEAADAQFGGQKPLFGADKAESPPADEVQSDTPDRQAA